MDLIKLKKQLQVEVDTAFLYNSIASIQTDDSLKRVLNSLADIEKGHAKHMLEKVMTLESNYQKIKSIGIDTPQKIISIGNLIRSYIHYQRYFYRNRKSLITIMYCFII